VRALVICIITLLLFGCAHAQVKKVAPPNPVVKESKAKPVKLPPKKEVSLLYPIRGGSISSPFGNRKGVFHRGLDIAAAVGTPVLACEEGKIVYVGRHKYLAGYGNTVLIQHAERVFTYYAHLNGAKVRKGEKVTRGQVIATVGNTGRSRGPHLHLELMMNGKNHNPVPYFAFDRSVASRISLWVINVKKEIASSKALKYLLGGG
jgi:murein DD-endopeptidase MepM/ murein hydrolase activator NlpD